MKIHNLKTKQKYFIDILFHCKRFEYRKNDRNFKVGDIAVLEEIDSENQYTGRSLTVTICYVLYDYLPENYCIFGFVMPE